MSRGQNSGKSSPRPLRPLPAVRAIQSAPDAGPSEQAADRLLSCIAGFYGDERQARSTAEQIQREHGLVLTQMVLLSPRDAPRKQFSRLVALWSGHWPASRQSIVKGRLSMVSLGVLVLLLAVWATVLWSDYPGLFNTTLTLPWLDGPLGPRLGPRLGLGLGLGKMAVWLLRRRQTRPRARRFETRVQQQLARGHWALVVCKLPWAQQAGVLALLRAGSLHSCAVADPSTRL